MELPQWLVKSNASKQPLCWCGAAASETHLPPPLSTHIIPQTPRYGSRYVSGENERGKGRARYRPARAHNSISSTWHYPSKSHSRLPTTAPLICNARGLFKILHFSIKLDTLSRSRNKSYRDVSALNRGEAKRRGRWENSSQRFGGAGGKTGLDLLIPSWIGARGVRGRVKWRPSKC